MTGLFITVEGQDGAGKTSNLAYIEELLTAAGKDVVRTREPGGTELGEALRNLILHSTGKLDPHAELLMIFAARAQHLSQIIEPALAVGKWVLCDRFTDATYAYQGAGSGIDEGVIATLENLVQGTRRPDLTLLLDVDPLVAGRRSTQRSEPDRFESEGQSFKQRVRAAYMNMASRDADRFRVIDASRSLAEVQKQIRQDIERFLASR